MERLIQVAFLLTILGGLIPTAVLAYGGPGSVISGIGAFLAAVAALLATLFGFLWFPLKRLYRRMTKDEEQRNEAASNPAGE